MMKKRIHLIVATLALIGSTVFAHESRPAYLELQQTDEATYEMLWKVPAKGPGMRLALYVRFSDDCNIVEPARSSYIGGAHVERSKIRRSGGLAGAEIYIEGLSTTLTDALVRIGRLDGTTQITRLTPDKPSFIVATVPGSLDVAKTYTVLGIQHIWSGFDHLLFVACLIFVAGIGRKLLVAITGFTVAHSITLALSTLGLVKLPIAPVEAVIALSILFLAVEIARGKKNSITYRYPVAVSSSFGLLHGFGFAAVLRAIGLPQTDIPAALLFFNVGVEVGQLLFVIVCIVAIKIVLRVAQSINPGASRLVWQRVGVYAIGTLASFWLFQRVSGF